MKAYIYIVLCTVYAWGFSLDDTSLKISKYSITCIINNDYTEAIHALESAMNNSDDPLYAVLKLSAIGIRDVDFEQVIDSTLFLSSYVETDSLLKQYLLKNKDVTDTTYIETLRGISYAIYASFYLHQKKYFAAMQKGFDAIEIMKNVQVMDSLNYEVDLFLGLYEFIRAELRSKLWWVLFWYPGNKKAGIKKVERCARNAIIAADAAKFSLCDMYQQDNRGDQTKKMIHELKAKYPGSRFVMWAEAKFYETQKKYVKAAELYSTLSKSYSKESCGDYNRHVTNYKRAYMLHKAGMEVDAGKLCATLLSSDTIYKYKQIKKDVKKLAKQCNATEY